MSKSLKKKYASLIAKEIKENLEPKDIEQIDIAKKEIRNRLIDYKLKEYIYKRRQ